MNLTFDILNRRWPHAQHSLVDGMTRTSGDAFIKFGLLTAAEIADFMAQISEETGGGTELEENLNYSAPRLHAVWPARFPSVASAAPFAHNPRALADRVYNGRMGNAPGSDDGWNFRGRGGIQVTGRTNYAMLATLTALPLLTAPELMNDPVHFVACACAFWQHAGLNKLADSGNFRAETLRVNGGLTNFAARQTWRKVWRTELC
jgi:putative chitinase